MARRTSFEAAVDNILRAATVLSMLSRSIFLVWYDYRLGALKQALALLPKKTFLYLVTDGLLVTHNATVEHRHDLACNDTGE